MKTNHKILIEDSRKTSSDKLIKNNSIDLVVTSPPYPMIEMWDDVFCQMAPEVGDLLGEEQSHLAFEKMHIELDKVWRALFEVLKPGGVACINIGDATRKVGDHFQLFPNHSRILQACFEIGFHILPLILWRKQTNAPNKFMGSGMLPPGAYVTLEHEYILVMRKGGKREFKSASLKERRQDSAYFWEERNQWFSDVWLDLKGTSQKMKGEGLRHRSGAFPFELAYRLVNMFSVYGDCVLDPFLGTGTTTLASLASGRNSIGLEIDPEFSTHISQRVLNFKEEGNLRTWQRVKSHIDFVEDRLAQDKKIKHHHTKYEFPVITKHERKLELHLIKDIVSEKANLFRGEHRELTRESLDESFDGNTFLGGGAPKKYSSVSQQKTLFK